MRLLVLLHAFILISISLSSFHIYSCIHTYPSIFHYSYLSNCQYYPRNPSIHVSLNLNKSLDIEVHTLPFLFPCFIHPLHTTSPLLPPPPILHSHSSSYNLSLNNILYVFLIPPYRPTILPQNSPLIPFLLIHSGHSLTCILPPRQGGGPSLSNHSHFLSFLWCHWQLAKHYQKDSLVQL